MFSSTNAPKNTDLDFIYADCDTLANEISELYSYTEEDEFFENRKAFENLMRQYELPIKWTEMNENQHNCLLDRLANIIELSSHQERTKSVRSILYLLQGIFGECLEIEDQKQWAHKFVIKLYKKEFFHMFVQLLLMEIEFSLNDSKEPQNQSKSSKDSQSMYLR